MASSRSRVSGAPASSSSVNGPEPMEIVPLGVPRSSVYQRSGADEMLIRRLRRTAFKAMEDRDVARRESEALRADVSALGVFRRERDRLQDEVGLLRRRLEESDRKLEKMRTRYSKLWNEFDFLVGRSPDFTDESEVEGEDEEPGVGDDEEEEKFSEEEEGEGEEEEASDDDS